MTPTFSNNTAQYGEGIMHTFMGSNNNTNEMAQRQHNNEKELKFRQLAHVLKTSNIPYFLMGSRRFGYNTYMSDHDIAVQCRASVLASLFTITPRHAGGDYTIQGGVHFRVLFQDMYFDVVTFEFSVDYAELENQHYEIDTYLDNHPIIRTFIRDFKKYNMKHRPGPSMYKALVDMNNITKHL